MKCLSMVLALIAGCVIIITGATARTYALNPLDSACQEVALGSQKPTACDAPSDDPLSAAEGEGIIIKAARLVSIVTGVAAVIIIALAAMQYILSSGESAKVASARNAIVYAAIGLVISLTANLIISFVIGRL